MDVNKGSKEATTEVKKFAASLKTDSVIKIFIGNDPVPYCVQETVLTSISDYFVKAIENQHLGTVQPGTLTFPEDNECAWKSLLYWKINGSLPELDGLDDKELQLQLVQLWVLGDKYNITELQDLAMLELLEILRSDITSIDIVKVAFENTALGSPLRKLMAEETVYLKRQLGSWKNENFDKLDGCVGFTAALFEAMDQVDEDDDNLSEMGERRLQDDDDGERTEKWKEYMVSGGPNKHWVYD